MLKPILLSVALTLPSACDFPKPNDVPSGEIDAALMLCGNSKIDPGEECDSGGVDTGDCDRDCTRPACGDGVFNSAAGEVCDDGNTTDDDNGCDTQCRKNAVCGDSRVQSFFEACDDGGQSGGDGCSADCKEAVVALVPVSDQAGIDSNGNGTFDYLNGETSTGEAIYGGPAGPMSSILEEHRLGFELDTHALHREYLMKEAHFSISPNNISGGPRTMQLHGYLANGAVELQDMTTNNLIAMFSAASTAPVSLDTKVFLQTAALQQYPFTGFLLRLESLPQDGFFNMGVSTSNNTAPNVRPRLDMIYCVDSNHDGTCD